MIKLYSHGGSENHGCEAIVRSTVNILQKPVRLFSNHIEQDIKYGVNQICEVLADLDCPVKKGSLQWFLSRIQTKLTGKIDFTMSFRKRDLLQDIRKGDVLLSIGGDNYCYPGMDLYAAINRNLHKKGAKLVLWGCSVDPELVIQPEIAKDLASYELITARETISYEALKNINPNTILVADPAFTLERRDLPLPEGWIDGKMIGVNISPLILQSANDEELVLNAYKKLIFNIIEDTDFSIALIPHVVCSDNNDLSPLRILYEEFSDSDRVVLLKDYNCMELKGFIARCRMFIGARTHATIAAYSSCVPTLVLGYSVKSRGIARDLFGSEENYVLPVQQLKNIDELADGFVWIMDHEDEIRTHLINVIPQYIARAYVAKEAIKNI